MESASRATSVSSTRVRELEERSKQLEERSKQLEEQLAAARRQVASLSTTGSKPTSASTSSFRHASTCLTERSMNRMPDSILLSKQLAAEKVKSERLRAQLEAKTARSKAEATRKAQIAAVLRKASRVRICFLVDVTGSMDWCIANVATQISAVVDNAAKRFAQSGVTTTGVAAAFQVAFVGYRDYDDTNPLEVIPFTSDLAEFKKRVSKIRAAGGGDAAEDIFSGLQAVQGLPWMDEDCSHVLIHFADAPCHGSFYHDSRITDNYPSGDKYERDAANILSSLKLDTRINLYQFCHIGSATELMVQRFKEHVSKLGAVSDDWILEEKVDMHVSSPTFKTIILKSIFGSVHRSISTGSAAGPIAPSVTALYARDTSVVDPVRPDSTTAVICWTGEPRCWQGRLFFNAKPTSLSDLFFYIKDKRPLPILMDEGVRLRVRENPFSLSGAMRLPYYAYLEAGSTAKLGTRNLVAKVPRDGSYAENKLVKYQEQMEVQSVAAFLAEEFNKVCRKKGLGTSRLEYITAATFESEGSKYICCVEPLLKGKFVKYNSNYGYVNEEEDKPEIAAFVHWTFEATRGQLMVTDVQGVYDETQNRYQLFDPAIHCPADVLRFGGTNQGVAGKSQFFLTHECNEYCRQLGLPEHDEEMTGFD